MTPFTDTPNLPAGIVALGGFVFENLIDKDPLGRCCACGEKTADSIVYIDRQSLIMGHGVWGRSGIDGAAIVLCSGCRQNSRLVRFGCRGWPGPDGRAPIEGFTVELSRRTE